MWIREQRDNVYGSCLALDREVLPKALWHQRPEKDEKLVFPVDDEETLFRFNAFDDGGGDVRDVHFERIALAIGQKIRVNEAGSYIGEGHRALSHHGKLLQSVLVGVLKRLSYERDKDVIAWCHLDGVTHGHSDGRHFARQQPARRSDGYSGWHSYAGFSLGPKVVGVALSV